ncbi:kinase-like domain-containing protein [Mycotypha africana]|uniref:kinase-like domain-containing protein n=1 Tax=Mycotypha africana TaxID=64632 RepID=UPI002301C158|nr:kinase-like domain-containing protein [Mycotypha africana]KAI8979153.1 kinase-like domain-containing protein [Mycotypha africana]
MGLLGSISAFVYGQQPKSHEKKKNYTFSDVIGSGSFGSVKKATRNSDGKEVAIKIIPKKKVENHFDMVKAEISVMENLEHPNVIHLYDSFESRKSTFLYALMKQSVSTCSIPLNRDKFYIVFELATGGELFDRLFERGKFSEKDATVIVKSILRGLEYIHQHNVVHRDMKPENLLFRNRDSDADLLICDFGIAKLSNEISSLDEICGSPGYVAPEVLLQEGYGAPVDMWAMGVITYTLLCGYLPFQAEDQAQLIDEITHARYDFHERYWRNISLDAKNFIRSLLHLNAKERLTATQALQHKWLTGKEATDVDILSSVRENFNARKVLKGAVGAVQAMNRLQKSASVHNEEADVKKAATDVFAKLLAKQRSEKQQQQQQQQQ